MTLDELRSILHNEAPFTLHLVSGREFHVPHSDYVALTRNNSSLVLTDDRGKIETIRLSSIESVTTDEHPVS